MTRSVSESLVGEPVYRDKQEPSVRTIVAPGAAYDAPRRPGVSEPAGAADNKIETQKRGAKPAAAFRLIARRAEQNRRGAVLLEESLKRLDRVAAAANRSKKAARPKPTWLPPYNPSKYRFTLNPNLCSGDVPTVFLVLVQSAVKNFDRRALVRDTLREESSRHGDLVQSDFVDSYYNLSLSTVTGLRWAHENCKRYGYMVKADDDAFVNLAALRKHLASKSRLRRRGHHRLPDERARLPDFVSGFAYAVTRDAVGPLYAAAQVAPIFPFEDVYVTGMCRERAPVVAGSNAIALEGAPRFHNHRKKSRGKKTLCSLYGTVLAQHELTATETKSLWEDLKAGRCG
ncbi:hypothetical protein MTO96_035057 [Rhipicephalus appendiculatus]